jgi:capsular polysaccharide biosynthesis protein
MGDRRTTTDTLTRATARANARWRRDLEAVLGAGAGRALVAVDRTSDIDLERLRADHARTTFETLDVGSGDRLTDGSFDAVLDATRRPDLRRGLFEDAFPRLLPGGRFFVLDHRPAGCDVTGPVAEDVLWPRLFDADASPQGVGRVVLDEHHLLVERSGGSASRVNPGERGLPGLVRRLVRVERPTIAVMGHGGARRLADRLRDVFPDARIVRVRSGMPRPSRHTRLATYGPFDLVIDAGSDAGVSADLLRWCFLHVRRGGSMLVLGVSPLRKQSVGTAEFWQALTYTLSRRGGPPVYERSPELDWSRLALAIGRVDVGPRNVVLRNVVPAMAMLRDRQLRHIAHDRDDPGLRVHRHRPRQLFTSRAILGEGTERDPKRMPETFRVPELQVHEYRDVVCFPMQAVTKGNLALPDSFRHPGYVWLTNRQLEPMGRLFALARRPPSERLEGTYFHLDGELRHHFGHATTEHIGRLWAWPNAKAANPDLRALVSISTDLTALPDWQVALYEAAGVPRDDIVTFRRPIVVDRLIGASPMFSMPNYVHPDIAEVWDRTGAALDACATLDPTPRRIFITRAPGSTRWCHETPELERIVQQHGYAVIRPERFALADQVRMFRRAEAVAGFAGSGMFNLMFASDPKPVLLIRSTAYTASNEYLIASVRGHHLETVACRPDTGHEGGLRRAWASEPVRQPGFHFDLDGDRSRLEQILRSFA